MQIHPRRWPEAFVLVLVVAGAATTHAWGPQGHRLVARVASEHLTEVARRNVTWLLGRSALHDVAVWADQQEDRQTATWHYVNIPSGARTYDRRRRAIVRTDGVTAWWTGSSTTRSGSPMGA